MHATREEAQRANLSFDLVDYPKPMWEARLLERVDEQIVHKPAICPKISRIQKNDERQSAQEQIEKYGLSYKPRQFEVLSGPPPAEVFFGIAQSITVRYKQGHSRRRAKLRYMPDSPMNFMALHMLVTSPKEQTAYCGLGNVQASSVTVDDENFMLVKVARANGSAFERAWQATENITMALINPLARIFMRDLPPVRKEDYLYIPKDTFECLFERDDVGSKRKKFTAEPLKP